MKITALLMASVSLTVAFANTTEQSNAVQLRKLPPNGGNINNGPEVVDVLTIVTPAGNVRINATDFDPATHTLAEGETAPEQPAQAPAPPAAAPPAPPVAVPPSNTPPDPNAPPTGTAPPAPPSEQGRGVSGPTAPAGPSSPPVEKFVTKIDKVFHITDAAGKPLDAAHPGFKTEAEAQAAVKG